MSGKIELPVKLKLRDSIFVPLANIEESRSVYNFVFDLCVKLGANPSDLVPFEKYAAAAQSLTRPASAARAV